MEYRIGSMNMYKFNYRSDSEISKNYQIIADLIVREQFDILAMQEVFNEGCIILTLKRYLGPNWAYVWAQPKSKSVQAAEGYAFLWGTRKFRLATGEKKDEHDRPDSEKDWRALKTYNARIYDNYRVDKTIWSGGLVRDPLYARFESVFGWFEIRLINYLPELALPSEKEKPIGIWGQRHLQYLKEYKQFVYLNLLTSGRLNE